MRLGWLALLWLAFASCQELIDAPVPDLTWKEFDAIKNQPLSAAERSNLEGVYAIGEQDDDFGKEAVLKWSYAINGDDTTHYLSFFCAEDVRYFICQAKQTDSTILLNGYWRNVENTKTGKAHFTLSKKAKTTANDSLKNILLNGVIGRNDKEPEKKDFVSIHTAAV